MTSLQRFPASRHSRDFLVTAQSQRSGAQRDGRVAVIY